MVLEKGHKLSKGRPKGAKNKLTNDVRAVFHRVYEEMGANVEVDGRKQTGHEAFLTWARDNQTEFYRLYGKMIPASIEIPDDALENFIDELIFAEELPKLVDGQAKVIDVTEMGDKPQITGGNGEPVPQDQGDNAPSDNEKPDDDVSADGSVG